MSFKIDTVVSPLKGVKTLNVTSDFGYRKFSYTNPSGVVVKVEGKHNGIDLTPGTDIVPIAKGKVIALSRNIRGYDESHASGNYVSLYHGNGVYSTYCHLDFGSIKVNVGDIVETYTVIGSTKVKSTGWTTGLHLHFAIKVNGVYVDPKPYLKGEKLIVGYSESIPVNTTLPTTYLTVKNDTLSGIAKKFYGNGDKHHYDFIASANGITAPNQLGIGVTLNIPVYVEKPKPEIPTTTPLQIGDTVQIIKVGNASSWGRLGTANGIGWTRKIKRIWGGRPFPYQVGTDAGTTGFYKEDALKKI